MNARVLWLTALFALGACGGGGGNGTGQSLPLPVTIANPLAYFAQSQQAGNGAPLGWADPWTYRRHDFGHYQIEQSYLRL